MEQHIEDNGYLWATICWDGPRVVWIRTGGAKIICDTVSDPLLGDAHSIVIRHAASDSRLERSPDEHEVTRISAIDWARPTEIPAIAAPGALPPGAGGAIMNVLAILAEKAGVPALRYAGPYPTSALYKTLTRSFRTSATEQEFTADLLGRMTRLARDPIPIDFTPAPHQRRMIGVSTMNVMPSEPHDGPDRIRLEIAGRLAGHVELRDRVERVVIEGIAYERDGSPARLVDEGFQLAAEVWFGDLRYARIASFTLDGEKLDGPHEIPPCTSDVVGKPFPPQLANALAGIVLYSVPQLLALDAKAFVEASTIVWADLGARSARVREGVIEVHAALWQHVAPHGMARLALALEEAIAPAVTAALVSQLARER